jgi:VanZ family protein
LVEPKQVRENTIYLETPRMATSPALLNPSNIGPRRDVRSEWLPVAFAILFVCFTSTAFMGGSHTQIWIGYVWRGLVGQWHYAAVGTVNEVGRKVGHFLGYGTIGLLFRKAWYTSIRAYALAVRSQWMFISATLGVGSTFVLASLDEWHQTFLPGRVGCFRDVMLDTVGALFLNLVLWAVYAYKRKKALNSW